VDLVISLNQNRRIYSGKRISDKLTKTYRTGQASGHIYQPLAVMNGVTPSPLPHPRHDDLILSENRMTKTD